MDPQRRLKKTRGPLGPRVIPILNVEELEGR